MPGRDALRLRQVSKKWNAAIPPAVSTVIFTGSGDQLRSLCYTCPKLRCIELRCHTTVQSELRSLVALSQLTELDLSRGGVFMRSGELNKLSTTLRTLKLGLNRSVMDDGIFHRTNLTALSIGSNHHVTGWSLRQLPLLAKLEIDNGCITEETVRHLTALTHLSGFFLNARHVSDFAIRQITRLTSLGCLNGPCVSDFGLSHLSHLRQLHLISNDRVSDYGLCGLTALTDLTLDHCEGVTDLSVQFLTNLTSLSITHNNGISNDSISRLVRLQYLHLEENTRVTDAGLVYLHDLREVHASSDLCNISRDFAMSVYMRRRLY